MSATTKAEALKRRLFGVLGAGDGFSYEDLCQSVDELVEEARREGREPVAPPAEDGPEYPLSETLAHIEEWSNSPDPVAPDNLIEIFQAAAWWLRLLLRMRDVSPITRWLRMGAGHGMQSKQVERREGDAEPPIGVALMDENGIVELAEGATHDEAEALALQRIMTRPERETDPE